MGLQKENAIAISTTLATLLGILLTPSVSFAADCTPRELENYLEQANQPINPDNPPSLNAKFRSIQNLADCGESAIPFLLETLQNPDLTFQNNALFALQSMDWDALEVNVEELFPTLLEVMENPDVATRESLPFVISDAFGPQAIPLLLENITHENAKVRSLIVNTLGQMPASEADPLIIPLIERIVKDPDEEVQASAVRALGKFENTTPPVTSVLTQSLRNLSPNVRESAANSLGELEDIPQASINELMGLLQDDSIFVQLSAIRTLGQVMTQNSDPEILSSLLALLQDDDPQVRTQVIFALSRFAGETDSISPDQLKIIESQVSAMVTDEDPERRSQGVQLLGVMARHQDPETLSREPLFNALEDPSPQVRITAIQALGNLTIDDPSLLPLLFEKVEDPDPQVQEIALSTLNYQNLQDPDPALLPIILNASKNPNNQVRASAITLFSNFSSESETLLPILTEALQDSDPQVRRAAVMAVSAFEEEGLSTLDLIIQLLDDPDTTVVQTALYTLGRWKKQASAASPQVRELVTSDREPQIQSQALTTLAEISANPEEVAPLILEALEEGQGDESRLYEGAITAIIELDLKETTPQLLDIVQDTQVPEYVRIMAMRALYELESPELTETLITLLSDSSETYTTGLNQAAVMILGKMGEEAKAGLPVLRSLLEENSDPDFRKPLFVAILSLDPNDTQALNTIKNNLIEENFNDSRVLEAVWQMQPKGLIPVLQDIRQDHETQQDFPYFAATTLLIRLGVPEQEALFNTVLGAIDQKWEDNITGSDLVEVALIHFYEMEDPAVLPFLNQGQEKVKAKEGNFADVLDLFENVIESLEEI